MTMTKYEKELSLELEELQRRFSTAKSDIRREQRRCREDYPVRAKALRWALDQMEIRSSDENLYPDGIERVGGAPLMPLNRLGDLLSEEARWIVFDDPMLMSRDETVGEYEERTGRRIAFESIA